MNKRLLSVVLVLMLMLSMATTALAATTEAYYQPSEILEGAPIKLSISNVESQGRTKLGEKELQEYIRDTKDLDESTFWVVDYAAGDELDEDTEFTRSRKSLRVAIEQENVLGGVPAYYVEGPVVITAEDALGGMKFYWKDANIKTTYKGKYYDFNEYFEATADYDFNENYDVPFDGAGLKVYDTAPESWVLARGTTAELIEPGKYLFFVGSANGTTAGVFAVHVGGAKLTTPAPAKANATPTASTVLVNGTSTEFEAYTINGNNYFKLRDLAQVVNGTEKNFEVEWDGAKNAINLISNKAYTPAGGELAKGDNTAKNATPTTSKIYKDGVELSLTAYTIGGNNFFKLRDIAQAFNIGVTWDGLTKTVGIDTSIGYVAE